jgi:hypothetical protein
MTWTRRRKWLAASAAVLLVLLGIAVAARMMAANRLLLAIQVALRDRYGVEAHADDVALSLRHGTAVFKGFHIVDGPVTVFEAERVDVAIAVRDVLGQKFDCSKVRLLRPVLRVSVEAGGETNVQRILRTPLKGDPATAAHNVILIREGSFEDGRLEFTDAFADPENPLRLTAVGVRGSISEWQFDGEPATDSFADFRVDGTIEQTDLPCRFSITTWCSPPAGVEDLTMLAVLTGIDLRGIPQYVGAGYRAAFGGDFLHVAVNLRARDRAIVRGAAVGEVAGTGTLLPLAIGGTLEDPMFDAESTLATLLNIPLGRVGRIGSVALDAGWSVVKGSAEAVADIGGGVVDAGVSLGTGLANAGEAVIAGDPIGAVTETGAGALGVATSIGEGIIQGVMSIFGGGAGAYDAISGADAARLNLLFESLHATRRLKMLEAALTSAAGADSKARQRRILDEIEDSSPPPD